MKKEFKDISEKRTARIIAVISIIVIAALLATAIIFKDRSEPTREEILNNISENTPGSADKLTDYLRYYGISGYDEATVNTLEKRYTAYYYIELPPLTELAKETALIFMDNFYDTVDKEDEELMTKAIASCYIAAVGDKYGYYRSPEDYLEFTDEMNGEHVGIGISVLNSEEGILVVDVMEASPAMSAGMLPGDVIVSVNGIYLSDEGEDYDSILNMIRGEAGTEVTVGAVRDGTELSFTMVRAAVVHITVKGEMLPGNIAYIRISEFKANTPLQFKTLLDELISQGACGVIFDLSSNPGGYLTSVSEVLSLLVPDGTVIAGFSNSKSTLVAQSGTELEPTDRVLNIPSAVIFNEYTASAGELFSAALRDYNQMGILRAVTVGKTTYKKGVMQSSLSLGIGKGTVTLTTAYYTPPSGVCYHDIGVIPEHEADTDTALSVAYEKLQQLITNAGTV